RRPEVGSQVSSDLDRPQSWARALPARVQVLIVLILVFAVGAGIWVAKSRTNSDARDPDAAGQSKKVTGGFYPTPAQWATLTVEPVQQRGFQAEHVTEARSRSMKTARPRSFLPMPDGCSSYSSSPAIP